MTRRLSVALCAVAMVSGFAHAAASGAPCQTLDITSDTVQERADAMIARGWYGDPTDGAERIYSPACR